MNNRLKMLWAVFATAVVSLLMPVAAMASEAAGGNGGALLHLTDSGIGYAASIATHFWINAQLL